MHPSQDLLPERIGGAQQAGSVAVFLDETYEPYVAAAAVVVESTDVHRMEVDIAETYERVRGWYHLDGKPNFDEFRRRGFHATKDPYEVRSAFVAFLVNALNFKTLIAYSDKTSHPNFSEKRRLIVVFDRLLRDVLRAYRSRPKVLLCFESGGHEMDTYVERLARRVESSLGSRMPEVEICFGTKKEPHLLAVPDYVLHIFNRWLASQSNLDALSMEPDDQRSTTFKVILGSISMARSIDSNRVIRRTLLNA